MKFYKKKLKIFTFMNFVFKTGLKNEFGKDWKYENNILKLRNQKYFFNKKIITEFCKIFQ